MENLQRVLSFFQKKLVREKEPPSQAKLPSSSPLIENPFANYGRIVYGQKFIGRSQNLKAIENRIIRPSEPGNLAIVGERRIGKSSLAYQGIIERKDELIAKKMMPIWINLGTYERPDLFFRDLMIRCIEELKKLGWLSNAIQDEVQKTNEPIVDSAENYLRVTRFFEKVYQTGIRTLFILDEFDHARYLFAGNIPDFQRLRELPHPKLGINLVTISRRNIREIETQIASNSTLDGTFQKHYLGMFDKKDMQDYFSRLTLAGLSITSTEQDRINFYCGSYPFLLSMLGFEIVENFYQQQQTDIDQAAQYINSEYISLYRGIIDRLREDNSLGNLLQILFGDVNQVGRTEVDNFLRYGLIKLTEQENYVAFSTHFQTYLSSIEDSFAYLRNRPLRPKDRLSNNRYEITEVISSRRTGNSFVYKGIDHDFALQKVAIKEPTFFYDYDQHLISSDEFERLFARYRDEIQIVAQLHHTFIAPAYEFVSDRYMVQIWVEGKSLREMINQAKKNNEHISIPEVVKIGRQVCEALGYAYAKHGLIHRDIKPENIIRCDDGNIRIIDFGLAQAPGLVSIITASLSEQKSPTGSLLYMAQEQSRGEEDHRADIFSLGVTLYELLVGKLPYPRGVWTPALHTDGAIPPASSIRASRPDVTEQLENYILTAIKLAPGDRYATWKEFETVLQKVEAKLS
ncbi:MAG: serine/threonine protein kinase [Anaerolineae bacterium]|nr:serine/threonine protein kinase [Anaerolineae bacterium]